MKESWVEYAELCPNYLIENLKLVEKYESLCKEHKDKKGRKKGLPYNIKRKIKEKE